MVLMEQVLFNLFDNAAKYAPQGSRITITARHEDGFVVIRVLDEGEGIPEADLERIFDKFYRVRRSDRQRAGTGLGLAICRGFVEAMGGSITAANRIDRPGAVFTIRFPVPVTPRLARPRPCRDARAGPLRILIVDDEPPILRFLRASLRKPGLYRLDRRQRAHRARYGPQDTPPISSSSTSVCPTWMASMS